MKRSFHFILLIILSSYLACKQEPSAKATNAIPSEAVNIAKAHGIEQWDAVQEISFRFNISRDSMTFGRSWRWNPKSGDVTRYTDMDTVSYNRAAMDSAQMAVDRQFINDKFWLLIPFQLVWDNGVTYSDSKAAVAPISGEPMQVLTIQYADSVGYTPGDAYDIFYDNQSIIREWQYRREGNPTPNLVNTFTSYQTFNGLVLATEHRRAEGDWNLFFTDITVLKESENEL